MTTGAIASGHPEASHIAADVLRAGGSAFDAGIAAIAAACVAEPVLASLAGGGFAMTVPAISAPRLFDFFVSTPAIRRRVEDIEFEPLEADFGAERQTFQVGRGTCAVPGIVSGLFALHDAFGRVPIDELLAPAAALAERGVRVREFDAELMRVVAPIVLSSPESRALFADSSASDAEHTTAATGKLLRQPALADLLEAIGHEGPALFYQGEAGAQLLDYLGEAGQLRRSDLESYATSIRAPLQLDLASSKLLTNPPPAAGGAVVALALHLLDSCREHLGEPGSGEHLRLLVRALHGVENARAAVDSLDALTSPRLREQCAARLRAPGQARRGTTHISIGDAAGNLFSATLSNGSGSGRLASTLGLVLNNMLGEEDLNPGGFQQWPTAQRLVSMMAPSVLLADPGSGRGRGIALGSGGSNRIRSALTQVLSNTLHHGLPLAEAVAAPRLHYEQGHLSVEAGWRDTALQPRLSEVRTHKVWAERSLFFGGVHCVQADGHSLLAVADERRAGFALNL